MRNLSEWLFPRIRTAGTEFNRKDRRKNAVIHGQNGIGKIRKGGE